jgi:hypothetical protein
MNVVLVCKVCCAELDVTTVKPQVIIFISILKKQDGYEKTIDAWAWFMLDLSRATDIE